MAQSLDFEYEVNSKLISDALEKNATYDSTYLSSENISSSLGLSNAVGVIRKK